MDFLKSIDFSDPTIVAAIIAVFGVIITGGFYIIGAFIARGKKAKAETPPPTPVIEQPSSFQFLHQIPPPDGDFIGREKELQELLDKVKQSGVHISGIRGMGGIGKTQLAYRLVEEIKPRYPDAQIYLDLKGVTEKEEQIPLKPAEALSHIIRAFEPEIQLPEKVEELRPIFLSILDNKKAILLMDNALDEGQTEPLIPPAGSILLVTSRKKFHLPEIHPLDLETLPKEKSIQMLLKISDRIGDHAEQIAELCGHLPLALNVAGKAMAVNPTFSPEEYIEDLKKNEALGPVDASITASSKWLEEAECNYFFGLSVFPGSFDSKAAGAVWGLDEGDVKKSLRNLINISLVEWKVETERYHLHDLTRVFARKQLDKKDIYANQKQHAEHFLNVLAEANALYEKGGEDVLVGLQLFDLEWENIETGQAWVAKHSESDETATSMCNEYPNAGAFIFAFRQHPREHIQWRENALAASQKLKIRENEGVHLGTLGIAYNDLGDYQKAIDYQEKARQISQEIGDKWNEGITLCNLGNTYFNLSEYQKAIDYREQALQITQEVGDKWNEGITLCNLGNAYFNLNEYQKAIDYHERALKIAQDIGDKRNEGNVYFNMCLVQDKLGHRARAIELAEEVLKIYDAIREPNVENVRRMLEEWKKEA